MKIEPVALFSTAKESLYFLLGVILLFAVSLGSEYRAFSRLTRFDDATLTGTVVRQYVKRKAGRRYQLLKLHGDGGVSFLTAVHPSLRDLRGRDVTVRLKTDRLDFLSYLRGFYARGYVEAVSAKRSWNARAAEWIASQHADAQTASLFAALFAAASPIPALREKIGALGIGHLLAISGFHIGLLSGILYGLLGYPYRLLQSRRFPWRSAKRDLFAVTALVMAGYASFLQMPPSVLRAYAMMLVGFALYDRGIRLLSFHSLLLTVLLLIALWPRLLFSVGFWLSVAGVFYIFVFLLRFRERGNVFIFFGMHVWVYLMMLPITLALFGTFSRLHPLSVFWTMLFIPFYPLALLLHLLGLGGLLDAPVQWLLRLPAAPASVEAGDALLAAWIGLSLLMLPSQTVQRLAFYLAAAVLVGAVYQVA